MDRIVNAIPPDSFTGLSGYSMGIFTITTLIQLHPSIPYTDKVTDSWLNLYCVIQDPMICIGIWTRS